MGGVTATLAAEKNGAALKQRVPKIDINHDASACNLGLGAGPEAPATLPAATHAVVHNQVITATRRTDLLSKDGLFRPGSRTAWFSARDPALRFPSSAAGVLRS